MPGWVSAPQAHSTVSNINFDMLISFLGGTLKIFHEKLVTEGTVLSHLGFMSKILPGR